MPLLRVRVSDARAVGDFRQHLARQGFPSLIQSRDELTVLFPGQVGIFAPAVELDLWRINHPAVTVTVIGERDGR